MKVFGHVENGPLKVEGFSITEFISDLLFIYLLIHLLLVPLGPPDLLLTQESEDVITVYFTCSGLANFQ